MKRGETRTWVANPPYFTPEELAEKGDMYLDWCQKNPLLVEKKSVSNGEVITYTERRARAPSIKGFALYIGVNERTVYTWRKSEQFGDVATAIADKIATAQYEGGQAGIFNTTITTRILGLNEQVEMVLSKADDPGPKPEDRMIANLIHPDCTNEQLDAIYAAGLQPMLFSAAQLEAGMPWTMPNLSAVVEATPVALPKPWERQSR